MDTKLDHVNVLLEHAAKDIADAVSTVLGATDGEPVAVRHAAETLFAYLHEQAAVLEVTLLSIGIDEDVVDALVDSYRGDVPAKLQALRDDVYRAMRAH